MRDARWIDVGDALRSAEWHLAEAASIFADGGLDPATRAGYRAIMALLHAMQSGYTSFETSLVRTMELLGEERPTGSDWHARLVARAAQPVDGLRPAMLTAEITRLAQEVRAFRHWAMHGYDSGFDETRAERAVRAADELRRLARPALDAFAAAIDPEPAPLSRRPSPAG